MSVDVDILRRIYAHNESAYLEIGDWPESTGTLELRTTEANSVSFFGKVNIVMTPEYAMALGQELIAAANLKLSKK